MHVGWFVGVLAGGAGLVGCSLGLSGLGAEGPAADASAAADALEALDAGVIPDGRGEARDAVAEAASSEAGCAASVPDGWSLTLYEGTRAPCPPGSGPGQDAVAGGDAGVGACTCTCSMSGAVGCETGTLQFATGTAAGSCASAGTPVAVTSERCAPLPKNAAMPAYLAVPPLPAAGGCTSSGASDPTKVTKAPVRLCPVSGAAADGACAGQAPAGFQGCLAHPGTVDCPASGAFQRRALVSDDVELSCSGCSPCGVTGTCTGPTVAFFADTACSSGVIALGADGTCTPTDVANVAVGSILYNAALADAGCVPGAATATVAPAGAVTTVCCR